MLIFYPIHECVTNGRTYLPTDGRLHSLIEMSSRILKEPDNAQHPTLVYLHAGSAADTQAIADVVKYHLSFYEIQTGEPALVKTAANIFREMCYNYRDSLTAGIIVAGWDHKFGGKWSKIRLYSVLVNVCVKSCRKHTHYNVHIAT